MFNTLVIFYVPDFHFKTRIFFAPVNSKQTEMVFHNRAFNSVIIWRGKKPGRSNATGGNIKNRILTLCFQLRYFSVVYIACNKKHPASFRFFDECQHSLLFVWKVSPGFIAVERNTKLR